MADRERLRERQREVQRLGIEPYTSLNGALPDIPTLKAEAEVWLTEYVEEYRSSRPEGFVRPRLMDSEVYRRHREEAVKTPYARMVTDIAAIVARPESEGLPGAEKYRYAAERDLDRNDWSARELVDYAWRRAIESVVSKDPDASSIFRRFSDFGT